MGVFGLGFQFMTRGKDIAWPPARAHRYGVRVVRSTPLLRLW
jgi:hypothetical protein